MEKPHTNKMDLGLAACAGFLAGAFVMAATANHTMGDERISIPYSDQQKAAVASGQVTKDDLRNACFDGVYSKVQSLNRQP